MGALLKLEEELSDDQFKAFAELVYAFTKVSIGESRITMLRSRIRRRMLATGIATFSEYYSFLTKDKDEQQYFIDKVTTHETRFFRTPSVWEFLKKLPASFGGQKLRVWSAASSTGEEAVSLAITLTEQQRAFEILGTDVSAETVRFSKEAKYSGRTIERMQKEYPLLVNRYFLKDGDVWHLSKNLKQSIQFRVGNLFQTTEKHEYYDIILLRNVLIYFSDEDIETLLRRIVTNLAVGGYFIIGESESIAAERFGLEAVEPQIYLKRAEIS